MEIVKSYKELQDEIGTDLAEEVRYAYPKIEEEKKINIFFGVLDWFEDFVYSVNNKNTIESKVFSTIFLSDIVDKSILESVLAENLDKTKGFICSDGTIITWIDEEE